MGLRFRKSVNLGGFRLNFSKSGIGYSIGGKGFRFTQKANGGYRTTISIPGSGISYVTDSKSNINQENVYENYNNYKLKSRKKGCLAFFIILILIPVVTISIFYLQEKSGKTIDVSDQDLLFLENHPMVFDTYSYTKDFYDKIENKNVKVLDSVRYNKIQKSKSNVFDDDIILYLISDSEMKSVSSIHINLTKDNLFSDLNINKVKDIALSYLPDDFFQFYINDAAYQFSDEGVTTYVASYRINENGLKNQANIESQWPNYYYFKLINFTNTNKWQIKTGNSAHGGKDLGWINNYSIPWDIE